MKTKLWHLYATEDGDRYLGYDCYFAFIIETKTEQRAREIAQEKGGDETRYRLFWTDPTLTICEELKPSGEEGVIVMEDFHAG